MSLSKIKYSNVYRCLICHDAPCTSACDMSQQPSEIIRSLRFDNACGAIARLNKENSCQTCSAQCVERCPAGIDIPFILSEIRKDAVNFEEASDYEKVDLSVDLCSVKLENPFLLSSSVVASNYEMCARAFEMGWAGAAFKTISLMDIREVSPRFSALKNGNGDFFGFKNVEQLSDHSLEENLDVFRRLKKDYPTKVLIASIMGRNEEEWTYLAQAVTKAGADIIECNFSCPNMETKDVGVDVGQDPEAVGRYTAAVRRGSSLPVLAKMTPNLADMRPAARAAAENGADGIAAINTIKSITNVNVDTYVSAPAVMGASSVGGYSGAAVKPVALRFIADLAGDDALKGRHISGMGGIETWRDAVEFLLLGAGSLQITTAVMQYGYRIIDDLTEGLKIYMAQRCIEKVSDIIGMGVENVKELDTINRSTVLFPKFNEENCVGCGRCFIACRDGGHQAISFDSEKRRPVLNGRKCVGCHLCVLVCPHDAVGAVRKRITVRKKD